MASPLCIIMKITVPATSANIIQVLTSWVNMFLNI